jgi:hypothetical protein
MATRSRGPELDNRLRAGGALQKGVDDAWLVQPTCYEEYGVTLRAVTTMRCHRNSVILPFARPWECGLAGIDKNYQKLIAFKKSLPCVELETTPPRIRQNIR